MLIGVTRALAGYVAVLTTTLNPADTGTHGSLSGGNLTLTQDGTATPSMSRSTVSHTSGKYYFESRFVATAANFSCAAGIGNASANVNVGDLGNTTNSVGVYLGSAGIFYNGGTLGSVGLTPAIGDVLGVAVDLTGQLIWFRVNGTAWNNNVAADPVTGTAGISIATLIGTGAMFAIAYVDGNAVNINTVNFGATAYTFAAPAGFGNW